MLSMGRKRVTHKDIPPGSWRIRGRKSIPWRASNADERLRVVAAYGKNSVMLGSSDDLDAVWKAYHLLKAKLRAIDSSTKALGTVSELLADYRTLSMPKLAVRTRGAREAELKQIEVAFGTKQYATCESEAVTGAFLRLMHVQKYLADNLHRPVSANHVVRTLNQVFVTARQQGRTEYNPCAGAGYHTELPRKQRPTDEVINTVYAAASARMQCMMDVAIMCGCRRQDILRLPLQDVDPPDSNGGVRITNWKQLEKLKSKAREQFRLGKRKSEELSQQEKEAFIREYPYSQCPELRIVMKRALDLRIKMIHGKRTASMTVFVNDQGKAVSETGFNSDWRRLREGLGIGAHEYHFHDHKRVAKTQADKIGVVAHLVLGHSDDKTTKKHYAADRQTLQAVPPVRKIEAKTA